MKNTLRISKSNSLPIILLITFLISGFSLIGNYQYLNGADGMSYISIAKLYISGDYANAINGYWGPLFSWLLIPFFYLFGSEPLKALYLARILSLIIGFFYINRYLAIILSI